MSGLSDSSNNYKNRIFVKNELTETNDLAGANLEIDFPSEPNNLVITANGAEIAVKFKTQDTDIYADLPASYVLDGESVLYYKMPIKGLELNGSGATRWRVEAW